MGLLFWISQYHNEQNKCEAAITVETKSNIPMISSEHGTSKLKLRLNLKLWIKLQDLFRRVQWKTVPEGHNDLKKILFIIRKW